MSEIDNQTDVNTSLGSSTGENAETTNTATVPVENRVAELNRKFSKFERAMEDKFGQLISYLDGHKQATAQPKAAAEAPITGILNNSVESIVDQKMLQREHTKSFNTAMISYPELNQDSDEFDSKFFGLTDKYYRALTLANDPEAPLKAARLAAMDLGKYEKIERERVVADEAKRMRTLGEGILPSKAAESKKSAVPESLRALSSLMKVDPSDVEAHAKKHSRKYGLDR